MTRRFITAVLVVWSSADPNWLGLCSEVPRLAGIDLRIDTVAGMLCFT